MIIKIKLEDNIKDFEVKDMEDLVSQVTQQLKDSDGNNLSEDDKLNAKWMDVYLLQKKIKLEEGMILNLNCSIKNDNLVRNNGFFGMIMTAEYVCEVRYFRDLRPNLLAVMQRIVFVHKKTAAFDRRMMDKKEDLLGILLFSFFFQHFQLII